MICKLRLFRERSVFPAITIGMEAVSAIGAAVPLVDGAGVRRDRPPDHPAAKIVAEPVEDRLDFASHESNVVREGALTWTAVRMPREPRWP